MPFAARDIREQNAPARSTFGNETRHEVLPSGGAKISRDRTLALVQPGPVNAGTVVGDRPTVIVGGAADGVDAYHLGAELSQGHAGQGNGHEAGDLHDPDAR